jgi:hypothetical protein
LTLEMSKQHNWVINSSLIHQVFNHQSTYPIEHNELYKDKFWELFSLCKLLRNLGFLFTIYCITFSTSVSNN